jgi:SAM-dependent methyltransferase
MERENWPNAERPPTLAASEDPQVDLSQEDQVCVACPLCGSSRTRLICSPDDLAGQRRYLTRFYRRRWRRQNTETAPDRSAFTQNYLTAIVGCAACGLLYRNPRPPQDAITQAYAMDRYDEAYLQAEFANQRAWARTKLPRFRERLLKHTVRRDTPRVLELGSFVGGFLAEGVSEGWEVLGVDPGRDVTSFCLAQGLPVVHGTLEEAALKPMSFDAVVIWNTFDQLPDPHRAFSSIVRLLTNGGLLVIRIPNGAFFSAAIALHAQLPAWLRVPLDVTMAWNNLLTFPYLYGYSTETLTGLAASYGFRRVACVPDTLMPTPGGHTKVWARMEERLCHWLCRAIWRAGWASDHFTAAPWLDLYFERACTDDEGAASEAGAGLGFVPVYVPTALRQSDLNSQGREEALYERVPLYAKPDL